jgi:hypothetical protein
MFFGKGHTERVAYSLLTSKGALHPEKFGKGQNATELLTSKGALHPEKFGPVKIDSN